MYHSQNFTHPLSSVPSPHYNMSQTTRLKNSINKTGLNSFISFTDILKTYPEDLIENAWSTLSNFIILNYQMGKGTNIN